MHPFKSLLGLALLVSSFIRQCTSSPLVKYSTNCVNITIPVSASAYNIALPTDFSYPDLASLLDSLIGTLFSALDTVLVSGTFDIAATYCAPTINVPSRANTLQFLVHGITYTKAYWFGEYYNDKYSWAAYANSQGYPVLAIDRIGNGASDHPDPILYLQHPMQIEVIHQIILKARAGSLPTISNSFSTIIYAGHSYGSILGNNLNNVYPSDANATILTGYSDQYDTAIAGVIAEVVLLPASIAQPDRYADYNMGYLEFSDETGTTYEFYTATGDYDTTFANLDYQNRGTIAVGEATTLALTVTSAPSYKGPVYVMTGQNDQIMCGVTRVDLSGILGDLLGGVLSGEANCNDAGILTNLSSLYPSAASFDIYVVPNSGHCWHLEYNAYAAFGTAHNWLAGKGF